MYHPAGAGKRGGSQAGCRLVSRSANMNNVFHYYIAASLVFLLCLFIMRGKGFLRRKNKIILVIILDLLFSTIASLVGDYQFFTFLGIQRSKTITFTALMIYHYLHCLLPYLFVLFAIEISGAWNKLPTWRKAIMAIPTAIFYVFLTANPWTNWCFRVDALGVYHRGDGIGLEYIAAFIYITGAFIMMIVFRKSIGRRRAIGQIAFLLMCVLGVMIQMLEPTMVVESFFEAVGLIGVISTVESTAELRDNHTGLYHREVFETDTAQFINAGAHFGVVTFRLINFGDVESTLGMTGMAELEENIAKWMRQAGLVKHHYCYHLRHGVFALLTVDSGDTLAVAEMIRDDFTTGDEGGVGNGLDVEVEIFAIQVPEEARDYDEIMAITNNKTDSVVAETRLYHGNDFEVVKRLVAVEEALKRAIRDKTIQVYYQPIYDNTKGRIRSAEALARLYDEELGFIPPDEFIAVAESKGLVIDVGYQVFEQVCRDLSDGEMSEVGIDFVEVNVSPVQCMKLDLDQDFVRAMDNWKITPSQINLEITESTAEKSADIFRATINKLKEAGFSFSLDDYGTGVSNIASLYEMKFSIIKMDKSILWNADNDESARGLMESIVNMVHGLSIPIVCEGVETEAQRAELVRVGVEYFQGYYFSKPLPRSEFLDYCRSAVAS